MKTINSEIRVGVLISTILFTLIYLVGWTFGLYYSNQNPEVFYLDIIFWAAIILFSLFVQSVIQIIQIAFFKIELNEKGILLKHIFHKSEEFFEWKEVGKLKFKKKYYSHTEVIMRSGFTLHVNERQFKNYQRLIYSIKKGMKHDHLKLQK